MRKSKHNQGGFSIVEAIVATIIIAIAVLGTMSLRYQSRLDNRRAEVGMAASRLGLMLAETWRGEGGNAAFDPIVTFGSDINIETAAGPNEPGGFTPIGTYHAVLNNIDCYTTLSYKDIYADFRALNVIVAWEQRGAIQAGSDMSDKAFALTVYADR